MTSEEEKSTILEDQGKINAEITTSVDELLNLLKSHAKIPMAEAAQKLEVGLDVVQSWVDFLVEEQIIGIEYKFTKPFIYLNNPEALDGKSTRDDETSFEIIKENFFTKAQEKNIPEPNIEALWKNHVVKAAESKKDFFIEEAEKRGIQNINQLWNTYKNKLMEI